MNARRFLSRSEASDYLVSRGLRIARQTLANFAVTGDGPPYRFFGSRVVYDPAELEAWIRARLTKQRRSTLEPSK